MSVRILTVSAQAFLELFKSGRRHFSIIEHPLPEDAGLLSVEVSDSEVCHLAIQSVTWDTGIHMQSLPSPVFRDHRLFWSSAPPTSPGIYFAKPRDGRAARVVFAQEYAGEIIKSSADRKLFIPDDALWCGPIDIDSLVDFHTPVPESISRG